MRKLIEGAARALRVRPRLFDGTKRLSRLLGRRSPLYNRLAKIPDLRGPLRFLQVGANDGLTCDPLREFVIRHGWQGVAVEPVPAAFIRLQRNYAAYPAVQPQNCAVAYVGARALTIYRIADAALGRYPAYASMLSSLDASHLTNQLPSLSSQEIAENIVECRTIEEILESNGIESLDFLHLDVEGREADILLNMDLARCRPRYVLFEHEHLSDQDRHKVEARLQEEGYQLEHHGADTLAIDKRGVSTGVGDDSSKGRE